PERSSPPQWPTSHAGFAYGCLWVVVDGMLQANSANSVQLQQALASIHITSGPAFTTLGPLQFATDTHRNIYNPLFAGQFINGTLHTVYPARFATAKVVWPPIS
ncbi:MAG: hypothetical protein M1368_12895, partial [Thaumarchaeota archaeon]|nr:hypothetical protein [Nitrososphaerota archaeon]